MNKYLGASKTWRGLPTQLFLLVILPFAILALAATLMSVGLHQNAMRTMVAERDLRAVETSANFLESKIQSEQEVVSVLAIIMLAVLTDFSAIQRVFLIEKERPEMIEGSVPPEMGRL